MKKTRMSLHTRLIGTIMLVFCLPLLLLGTYLISTLQGKLYDNAIVSTQGTLRQIGARMRESLDFSQSMCAMLASDGEIVAFLGLPQTERDTVSVILNRLRPFRQWVQQQNDAIAQVRVLHQNSTLLPADNLLIYTEDLENTLREMRQATASRYATQSVAYSAEGRSYGSVQDADVWYVSCIVPLSSFSDPDAVIEIAVDNRRLWESAVKACAPEGEALLLSIHGAYVQYTQAAQPYLEALGAEPNEGVRRLRDGATVVFHKPEGLDVSICCVIPSARTALTARQSALLAAALTLLFALTFALTRAVCRQLLRRLTRLSRRMDAVQKNPGETPEPYEDGDEIDRLEAHFNRMYKRLSDAFEREKQLLYADLTNQLKPHFLCNAMDMLRLQTQRYHQPELTESVQQINQYFRYSILRTGVSVPLADECENAVNYLRLVNTLRDDKVIFDLRMDAWTEAHSHCVRLPKLLLQPLIENAVCHGLTDKKNAYITIAFQHAEGWLTLSVEDNGNGMSSEALEYLQTVLRQSAGKEQADGPVPHIGLVNVINRLELVYAGAYRFDIRSTPRFGTGVRIDLRMLETAD